MRAIFRLSTPLGAAVDGQAARPESIAKLKTVANEWVKYFNNATDGNGSVNIKLKERK